MHPLIARHRPEITAICCRFHVSRLEVFGSAARQADFDPDRSDVDFLVEFDPSGPSASLMDFFALRDELARLLGRPVDLIMESTLRNPYVRSGIARSRETVYAA